MQLTQRMLRSDVQGQVQTRILDMLSTHKWLVLIAKV
jgi:hypothetical protein